MNDLRVGGVFCYRMEARDGTIGFDFEGRFTRIVEHELLEYTLDDARVVTVRETFDAEKKLAAEQQRQGWQAILNRFTIHVVAEQGDVPGSAPRRR